MLPNTILSKIFDLLPYPDLVSCSKVCSKWCSIVDTMNVHPSFIDLVNEYGQRTLYDFNLEEYLKEDLDLDYDYIRMLGDLNVKTILPDAKLIFEYKPHDNTAYCGRDCSFSIRAIYKYKNYYISYYFKSIDGHESEIGKLSDNYYEDVNDEYSVVELRLKQWIDDCITVYPKKDGAHDKILEQTKNIEMIIAYFKSVGSKEQYLEYIKNRFNIYKSEESYDEFYGESYEESIQ